MVAAAVFCGMLGVIFLLFGVGCLADRTCSNVLGGWLSGWGIVLVIIALGLAAAIAGSNVGTPREYLSYADFPGKEYQVVKVIGVHADKVELLIQEGEGRDYVSLPRDRVLNKEIPEDITVLRVLQAKTDNRAVYIFGDLPYADHDFFKK